MVVMVVHFEEVIALPGVVVCFTCHATFIARFTIANPAAVGKLGIPAGQMRKNGSIGLNHGRTHAEREQDGQQGCPGPKAR